MTSTPADFCIGESGIWFFSLMWEHGKNAEPRMSALLTSNACLRSCG